ncbi:MAG TPA: glycosyltransferase family 39 protein [Acidobacteriota bacterium]|nr:glycosyltransferase family 39 protein [Acidobacteriota bacterium]
MFKEVRNPFIVAALILFVATPAFLTKQSIDLLQEWIPVSCLALLVLSGIVLLFYLLRQGDLVTGTNASGTSGFGRQLFVLILILAAGSFLRLWQLQSSFEGMHWDEAYKGLDATAIQDFGERPVYLNWNAGREAMIAYLVALAQRWADHSILSVRIVTAIAGILTLLLFYLFARNLWGTRLAWISTFILAVSKWHIIHSRFGVRVALFPLFEVLVLYLVSVGIKAKRTNSPSFFWAGLFLGLGFYSYIAFRIFPLILLAFVLENGVWTRLKQHRLAIAGGCLAALLVTIPLIKFFIDQPQYFAERMRRTASWNEPGREESALALVMESTIETLGMFTYRGDSIDKHNTRDEPMLSPFVVPFFLLGLLACLANFKKPYVRFLLMFLILSLLPGFLSVHSPQASRTLAAVLPACLLAGIGLLTAGKVLESYNKVLVRTSLYVILGGAVLTGLVDALCRYPQQLDSLPVIDASVNGIGREAASVADLIRRIGPGCEVYVAPSYYFHATVEYLTYHEHHPHQVFTQYTNLATATPEGHVSVIIYQPNDVNLWWLRDDDQKNFFKWWTKAHGMTPEKIRTLVLRTYISYPRMVETSDARLIAALRRQYPAGKDLNLGRFSVYIVPPLAQQ